MQCYSGLALALATFLSSAILAHIYIYMCIYIYLGVLVDYETRCAVCGGSRWSPPRFAYGVLSSINDATVGIHKIACVNHREVP